MNDNHPTSLCCQMSNKGPSGIEIYFGSLENLLCDLSTERNHESNNNKRDNSSLRETTSSPLHFLAQASLALENDEITKKYRCLNAEGRERITVVPGPSGASIKLHRGPGKLPPMDLNKPFARKCRNRECNNLGGQQGKPRSIYCSKRCQSREQNLRQGRIKNVRSPTPTNSSPRSSPIPIGISPIPGASTPVPMIPTSSPLNLHGSVNPSPTSLSNSSPKDSAFSPIPMSSSLQRNSPLTLPKPTPLSDSTTIARPTPKVAKPTPLPNNSSFSQQDQKEATKMEVSDNLTLPPLLS